MIKPFIGGVLYTPDCSEGIEDKKSYKQRAKMQRLLKSKIIETNEKCLILKSLQVESEENIDEELVYQATKKRHKTLIPE